MNENCIFCKIINGEIPCALIYQDQKCIAFMDINPQNKGHLLLIPKEHIGRIQFVHDELLSYLTLKSKDIIISMIKNLNCDYVQLEIVGKGVPEHFHIHLIPRIESEDIPESEYKKYENGEMEEIKNKLKF